MSQFASRLKQTIGMFLGAVVAIYLLLICNYLLFGGFDINTLGIRIKLDGLEKPSQILGGAVIGWMLLYVRPGKQIFFTILTISISSIIVFGMGEAYMRLFRSENFRNVEYTHNSEANIEKSVRGPVVTGEKRPGITRILVQGDSITWGAGVRNWKDLYPYRLLDMLNKNGERYEMTTMALMGRETDWHGKNLRLEIDSIDPDIIVYQWYINDVEVVKNRKPAPIPWWWGLPFHHYMAQKSYLYFFIDQRLLQLAYNSGKEYLDYLNNDFAEGTQGWQSFREAFHEWATYAATSADRVIMIMYPSVPFSGEYRLKPMTDNVKKIAKGNKYTFPGSVMSKLVGADIPEKNSSFGTVRRAVEGKTSEGTLAYGPYTVLGQGKQKVRFRMKSDKAHDGEIAIIDVASDVGKVVHVKKTVMGVDFPSKNKWTGFELEFELESIVNKVEFRVYYMGKGSLSLDRIDVAVDYKVEIIDLITHMRGFNTHASYFDSHPNARTHAVIADVLFKAIEAQ